MACNKTLAKAIEFHSFKKYSFPRYSQGQFTLGKHKTFHKHVLLPDIDYVRGILLILLICLLYLTFTTEFKNSVFGILLSAVSAGLFAKISLDHQKDLNSTEQTLKAIDEVFKSTPKVIEGVEGNLKSFRLNCNYQNSEINEIRRVVNKVKSITSVDDKAVFLIHLAFKNESRFYEQIHNRHEYADFIEGVNQTSLTYILNNLEKLCQGIHYKVYKEQLVKDYIGSDIESVTSYLLIYIYARREVHAIRSQMRDKLISELITWDDGYKSKSDNNDFLYECLEYYCYKWHWSIGESDAVSFKYFHSRVAAVYHSFETHLSEMPTLVPARVNLPLLNRIKD